MRSSYGNRQTQTVNRMTVMALLTAAVVALQIICTFIKFGPFSITLALTPILVGGALYGVGAGAFLGGVFGAVVLLTGIAGWDGGTVLFLMGQNWFATMLICLLKGIAAGAAAAAVYKAVSKKNALAASVAASAVCPIVNTGIFVTMMALFFMPILAAWSDGANMIYYILFGLCGLNFVAELCVNLVLSTVINRIVTVREKQ